MAKILVADDNSNIQKMVGLALKDQGIDVVAVGNGEAAVRKISDIKPDLVLADVFMPVRNGYEVCRYVKEDSSLSHIPVILLVGAFDPLDEQEAQRVGADGVLKKPFVPPDPLISMVKSALTRAGVSLTPPSASAPAPEKTASPNRTGANILSGALSSKLSPMSTPPMSVPPQKLPEAAPEPVEDFAVPAAQLKIAEGQSPMAFGNLLDSESEEEAPAVTAKPMIDISEEHSWNEDRDVAEEEGEEESSHGGWHPSGGLDEEMERAASGSKSQPDWREQAFHGNSPAKTFSSHWTPAIEAPALVEAAQAEPVPISTAKKPEAASPFASDAWASTVASVVEQKFEAPAAVMPEPAPEPTVRNNGTGTSTAFPAALKSMYLPPAEQEKAAEPEGVPAPAIPETSWETEAKRAANLASTWDAAAPPEPPAPTFAPSHQPSPDETQDISAYVAQDSQASAPALPETQVEAEEAPMASAYSGQLEVENDQAPAPAIEESAAPPAPAPEVAQWSAPAEVPTASSGFENSWKTPLTESAPVPFEAHSESIPEAAPSKAYAAHEEAVEHASTPPMQPEPETSPVTEQAAFSAPDMDQLVARVLDKMNPDVLHKVTRELLKPVIEAIVRAELDSQK